MLNEIIMTLALGIISYYIGQKAGEELPLEKASEIVEKNEQTYVNLTAPKIWLRNTVATGVFNTPILGPASGVISLFEKGKTSGAYKVAGVPFRSFPMSPLVEIPALVLSGAQGIINTYNLLTKTPIDINETLKIWGTSSAILIPAAVIEEKELQASG